MDVLDAGNGAPKGPGAAAARLPVVVIGAGPVGLAAASHLLAAGERPVVLEAGREVGASIRDWGHVRVFSPWRYDVDEAARAMLVDGGWQEPPPDELPTGNDLIDRYLAPLAALPQLRQAIRLRHRVVSVAREGLDKMSSQGREAAPFELRVETPDGISSLPARAVIDASGTWRSPNPLGADGRTAIGEEALAGRIRYGIPDVLGAERERYAGRRVLVVGRGHSAFNVLLDLVQLRQETSRTEIIWATRKALPSQAFGSAVDDQLPARGNLGHRVQQLMAGGGIQLRERFPVARLERAGGDSIRVEASTGEVVVVDEIIGATGFRPDLGLTSELRLKLDDAVESPLALAPLIDPNIHSCGTVPPHGAAELAHPETDFYIVGMKSYGRAPTFLMLTGYEQVRSTVCALTGDEQGAAEVRLVLPETGVCSTQPVQVAVAAGARTLPVLQPRGGCCS
jgi:cation diffusion facilitator CzcD-associated flavoprotein CzcO